MENSNLPKLTDEQRKAALARAAQARRERTELLPLLPLLEVRCKGNG